MIEVIRLDGKRVWVNPHQIELIEQIPDVTLVMLSGRKIILRNKPEEIIDKIVEYRRRIGAFKNEE
jgi:flagellar protein FlbD